MRIKYLLNSVELGDEGRASVMFYAPGPWTAKPEYSNSDEPQWMRVEPESGEAGDTLIINIIGVGDRPTDRTYGGKVRITLKDGSDCLFSLKRHGSQLPC